MRSYREIAKVYRVHTIDNAMLAIREAQFEALTRAVEIVSDIEIPRRISNFDSGASDATKDLIEIAIQKEIDKLNNQERKQT